MRWAVCRCLYLLREYKGQTSVEQRFHRLKDPALVTNVSTGLLLSGSLPDTKTPGPTPRTIYWHSSGSPETAIRAQSLSQTPVKYPEPKQPAHSPLSGR